MDKKQIIFLSGVGRSGTTLLQNMLNAHPNICFLPETHFLNNYVIPHAQRRIDSPKSVHELEKKILGNEYFKRLGIDFSEVKNELIETNLSQLYMSLYLLLLEKYASDKIQLVGDKDPMLMDHVNVLQTVFPQSKFIHIYRDARDVIASRLKTSWGSEYLFITHLLTYKYEFNRARKYGVHCYESNYLEIRYENLLMNTETTLKRVCQFLSVVYTPEMLQYHAHAEKLVSKDELSWKKNVFKPVIKDNIGKGKKELTLFQVACIEIFLSKELKEYRYPIEKKYTFLNKMFILLYLYPMYGLFVFYRRYLKK